MSINGLMSAFNFLINLQGRDMTLISYESGLEITAKIAPSNYFRNLAGVEEINIEGQEFVVSKSSLTNYGTPLRGDRIVDPEYKDNTIKEVKPLLIFGQIAGYRLRTG